MTLNKLKTAMRRYQCCPCADSAMTLYGIIQELLQQPTLHCCDRMKLRYFCHGLASVHGLETLRELNL